MGSVTRRGKKWAARAYLGYDGDKRIVQWLGTFDTEREAKRAVREAESARDKGLAVRPDKQTVGEYMTEWLEAKRTEVRWGTWKKYRWLTTKHVLPALGKIQLTKLSPEHLQQLYVKLQTQPAPISNRSILHLHNMLHSALDRAVKWGKIPRNVTSLVSPPRPEQRDSVIWSAEELRGFLASANDVRYGMVFFLAAMTGMRRAEICGLRWEDIDLTNGELHVRRSLVHVSGVGPTFQETKTTRSRRTISIDPFTAEELVRHREFQLQEKHLLGDSYQDIGLVIAREDGRPSPYRTIDNQWNACLQRAGVPRMGIHGLRHTHASALIAEGVPINVVSERLGHARTSITMDIYVHSNHRQQRDAAETFARSIFGPADK